MAGGKKALKRRASKAFKAPTQLGRSRDRQRQREGSLSGAAVQAGRPCTRLLCVRFLLRCLQHLL